MKKSFVVSVALSFGIQFAHAQSAVTPPQPPAETIVGYQIGGQSANQQVWQKIVKVTGADGNFTFQTNQAYVELASGLNYQDPVTGQWLPSREEIDAFPGGAIAQYGQYKVIFGNNLNTAGAIDLQTPDGKELKSHVLGLSYFDLASGKSVLIAQTKDCQGEIAGSNQVLFADAFQGVSASVQYIYRRGSFEQNVILEAQLPSPESFGLSSNSCVLQVLTGFDSAPAPTITAITNGSAAALPDELLNFGTMYMTRGNAFLLGTNLPSAEVYKQWLDVNGRTVLVESVPLSAISASLSQLPAVAKATFKPMAGSVQYVVSSQRLLPPPAGNGTRTKMELARTGGPASGLVLDYFTVNGNEPNYTFQGDSTYYVSGPVYLSGTATFEGGSVIKYTNNNPFLDLSACTQIECLTAPYHPVVFTAKDDNSVGAPINGSIGYASGYYANPAIRYFPYGYGSLSLTNFRIAYAYQAVFASAPTMTVSLSDGQIVVCGTGFYTPGQTSAHLENMLFADVGLPLELYLANVQAQNVTFTAGGYALVGPAGSGPNYNVTLNLVNCVLANFYAFSTVSGITPTGDHNGFYNDSPPPLGSSPVTCPGTSNPFQIAGGGKYYLNNNQPGGKLFQGAGSTSIDPTLLNSLKTKTTRPPDISNIGHTITSDTFTTLVARDSESPGPDLGFHYYPLDYIFQNSTIGIATMTFPAGAAIGWQGQGFYYSSDLGDTAYINFNGTVVSNDYFVRCNAVQESDQSGGGTGIVGSTSTLTTVNATFTRFSILGTEDTFFDADTWDYAYNCEFWDGFLGTSGTSPYGMHLTCANCLFDRSILDFPVPINNDWNYFTAQNCTLHGGGLTLQDNSGSNDPAEANVRDSAFDGTAMQLPLQLGTADIQAAYNAYLSGATPLPNDSSDVTVSAFNWQIGPRGNFYLPPKVQGVTSLVDSGDYLAIDIYVIVDGATSATEPLSHFTTQTGQESDTGLVDIGYHYPFVLLKGDVLVSGNPAGKSSNASDEIDTYRFGDGSFFRSFSAQTEGSGRGLAIYNGNFYYTELNDGDVHICSYGTDGAGPNPVVDSGALPVAGTPQWRPGVGTQDLKVYNGVLYVLTGYPLGNNPATNSLQVFEINLTTGEKIADPININPPEQDPYGGTGTSDGFAVLPNGDFLINDYDGGDALPGYPPDTYREYDAASGQLVTGPGALVIDVSSFSAYVGFNADGGMGITCAPDGTLYLIVADVTVVNNEPHVNAQAIVHTDAHGGYISSQVINSQGTEDIDVMIAQ